MMVEVIVRNMCTLMNVVDYDAVNDHQTVIYDLTVFIPRKA